MITKEQIIKFQEQWRDGLVKIGQLREDRPECVRFTNEFLNELYAFDLGPVLFKPTKVAAEQFRPTLKSAFSYFINDDKDFPEDTGFALTPWTNVAFENELFILEEERALVMGNYFFTDPDGNIFKVEYTFGYRLYEGKLKVDLQHSSFPYSA